MTYMITIIIVYCFITYVFMLPAAESALDSKLDTEHRVFDGICFVLAPALMPVVLAIVIALYFEKEDD